MRFECRIVAPELPPRRLIHPLGGHECILEIRAFDGRLRQRQVRLTEARNLANSVAIRCYQVGAPKADIDTYWVLNIAAILRPDGQRHDTLDYLRDQFGIVIV